MGTLDSQKSDEHGSIVVFSEEPPKNDPKSNLSSLAYMIWTWRARFRGSRGTNPAEKGRKWTFTGHPKNCKV